MDSESQPEESTASEATSTERKSHARGAIQAALCVIVPIAVPPLLGMLYYLTVGPDRGDDDPGFLDVYSFLAVWGWSVWVYPHVWVYVHTDSDLAELPYPFLWAILQWAVIVSAFAFAVREWRFRWQFIAAIIVILVVCLVMQWLFNIPPFEMHVDGL